MEFMPVFRSLASVSAFVALAVFCGCCPVQPTLHESFGASLTSARLAQTANPRAGEKLSTAVQMDGLAAKQAVVSYVKSFEPGAAPKSNADAMFTGFGSTGGG